MPVDLSTLTTPTTPAEALATLLALLGTGANAFPVTSWQPGSVPMALLGSEAQLHADATTLIAKIANGGLLDYAALAGDDWLTLLAAQMYSTPRQPAVFAQGTATLIDHGGGPYTITAGQLTASSGVLRFRNTTGGTLALNGTLPLTWQAESPGQAYNVSTNSLNTLVTSLAGVTISNPGTAGLWLTQQGADTESNANLILRCKARWPDLGSSATADVYRRWALTASAEVVKTKAIESLGTGQVTLYIAGAGGPVSGAAVGAVSSYIAARRPLCVQVSTFPATSATVTVSGTVYVQAAYAGTYASGISTALIAYQNSLDLGATVPRSKLIELIMQVPGVTNVTLTLPATDFTPAATDVVSIITALSAVSV